jgi:hypothetical protein
MLPSIYFNKFRAQSKAEIDIQSPCKKSANALLKECNTMQALRFKMLPDSVQVTNELGYLEIARHLADTLTQRKVLDQPSN